MAYTDLAGLLTYMEGHDIEFVLAEEEFLVNYPFYSEIGGNSWREHFVEVYVLDEHPGRRRALYSVVK